MKNLILLIILSTILGKTTNAQHFNFEALDETQNNLVYANFGLDFGVTTTLGYARKFNLLNRKVLVLADYSFPVGKQLFDDFKLKAGTQFEIYTLNKFKVAGKLHTNYRAVNNNLNKANSFGMELGILLGYYQPTWYVAGEFGFDKAIATRIKHADWYLEQYPDAQTQWYTPTAGNFYYGVQGGYSFNPVDIVLRLGAVRNQFFKPITLPFYGQLEVHYKF